MGLAMVLKQPGQPTQKDSIFCLESCPSPKMWAPACWASCFPISPDSIIPRKVKGVISVSQMLCRVPNQPSTCRSHCLSQSVPHRKGCHVPVQLALGVPVGDSCGSWRYCAISSRAWPLLLQLGSAFPCQQRSLHIIPGGIWGEQSLLHLKPLAPPLLASIPRPYWLGLSSSLLFCPFSNGCLPGVCSPGLPWPSSAPNPPRLWSLFL